jgi:CheY-like chemotaxis protein
MSDNLSAGRFHIFILEDNEADRFMIKHSLREAVPACEITAFADGAEALAYIDDPMSRVPDLVMLDFNVPGAEGTSVLHRIRGNSRWEHAGVFMFTGSQNPSDMARVKMLGADKYLLKPIDLAGFELFALGISGWLEEGASAKKQGIPGDAKVAYGQRARAAPDGAHRIKTGVDGETADGTARVASATHHYAGPGDRCGSTGRGQFVVKTFR